MSDEQTDHRRDFLKRLGWTGLGAAGLFSGIDSLVQKAQAQYPRYRKPRVYQEESVLRVPREPTFIRRTHRKPYHNLVHIIKCNGARVGTGIFINPWQILTAEHVIRSKADYVVLHKDYEIPVTRKQIYYCKETDVAVICLSERIKGVHRLQFKTDRLKEGESVRSLTYNTPGREKEPVRYTKGILNLFTGRNPTNLIESNISVSSGNSGGVLLQERTGKIIGVLSKAVNGITEKTYVKSSSACLASGISNLAVVRKGRIEEPEEQSSIIYPISMQPSHEEIIDGDYREGVAGIVRADDGLCAHYLPMRPGLPKIKEDSIVIGSNGRVYRKIIFEDGTMLTAPWQSTPLKNTARAKR